MLEAPIISPTVSVKNNNAAITEVSHILPFLYYAKGWMRWSPEPEFPRARFPKVLFLLLLWLKSKMAALPERWLTNDEGLLWLGAMFVVPRWPASRVDSPFACPQQGGFGFALAGGPFPWWPCSTHCRQQAVQGFCTAVARRQEEGDVWA